MIPQLRNDWQEVLMPQFEKVYFKQLQSFLQQQYTAETVYPQSEQILKALELTAYQHVKVVMLGQDPYHGSGQAHGLSFSVQKGQKIPPSLRNMFKEMEEDLGCQAPSHGDLTAWAEQGILLLNTVLTVRAGEANSHKGQGWEEFTDSIIESLAKREQPVVFLLWGKQAQTKRKLIEKSFTHHVILEAPHPSPLSAHRGFFGSKPYSKINEALKKLNEVSIEWNTSSQQTELF